MLKKTEKRTKVLKTRLTNKQLRSSAEKAENRKKTLVKNYIKLSEALKISEGHAEKRPFKVIQSLKKCYNLIQNDQEI